LLEEETRVGVESQIDAAVTPQLRAVEIDLDDLGRLVPRRRTPIINAKVERGPEHEDDVGRREGKAARAAEEERMGMRERAARHSVEEDRRAETLEQARESVAYRGPPHLRANQETRLLRRAEELGRCGDQSRIGRRPWRLCEGTRRREIGIV